MNYYDIIFYAFAALTLFSAAIMVFSKNIIYSAVGLLFSFFGVAGIYVMLSADFVAIVQILIYVGGILVLLLFGVMLSQKIEGININTSALQFWPALLVVSGVLFVLIRVLLGTEWPTVAPKDFLPTTKTLGTLIMTEYLIPFEIISVLLLGALVGAAYIARKDT